MVRNGHGGGKDMLCIKNGTVHDGVHREGFQADILVEDGKIKAIG